MMITFVVIHMMILYCTRRRHELEKSRELLECGRGPDNPLEKQRYDRVMRRLNSLEMGLLRLDDTIMLMESFWYLCIYLFVYLLMCEINDNMMEW
jgi:hypothetical protein